MGITHDPGLLRAPQFPLMNDMVCVRCYCQIKVFCIFLDHNLPSGATAAMSQARPFAGLDTLNKLSLSLLQETLTHSGLKPYQPAP